MAQSQFDTDLVHPHYHSVSDVPTGKGPGKIALWEDLAYEVVENLVPGPGGAAQMGPDATAAYCDTTSGAMILYLPPLKEGLEVTVRIVAGAFPVQVTASELTAGVNGPPLSTFIIDPLASLYGIKLLGDAVRNTWWVVAEATS